MGWNWIINIASHCKVHVITEGEWRTEIEAAIEKLPQKDNIRFYYNPLPEHVRRMCWNQGDWRFYWYYRKWQREALDIAREIIANNRIDVIHQLNMIGFREPGYLWKIKEIPFVWGPVGGMGTIPLAFLKGSGIRQTVFNVAKNIITDLQLRFSPRVKAAAKRGVMIAATKDTVDKVKKFYGLDIPLINETGCYIKDNDTDSDTRESSVFNILWVGKFDFRKRLDIALEAIAKVKSENVKLIICGEGNGEQTEKYHDLAIKLGIDKRIEWKGKVDNIKVKDLMRSSHLFLFTSISDATSTVVLEAIEAGLPVLSFDACGFGPLVNDFAGKTIPVSAPDDAVDLFAKAIDYFQGHRDELSAISQAERNNNFRLAWNNKVLEIEKIYQDLRSKLGGGNNL